MSLSAKRTPTSQDVVRVVSGNFLEMFDFMVYGFYAATIAKVIFPSGNDFVSLMLSLTTFGIGFLMRPLGAVVLGAYIDRHGRRPGLIVSLGIMSAGVALIAFTPTYASIGMAAPILVVVGRLLQGFSAGAESGAVSVYLSEIAATGRRGFYVSWQSASQQVAVVFAAVIGVTLRGLLTEEQMVAWGWRIPFLIGCLIVPVLFWIRRSLQESEEFVERVTRRRATLREIYRSLLQNRVIVLKAVLLVTLTSVFFYMITAYTPTYASQVLGLSDRDSFILTACVGHREFRVGARHGSPVRSRRAAAGADGLLIARRNHRLSGDGLARVQPLVRANPRNPDVDVFSVRRLSGRHGRHDHRNHARRRARHRLLAGVQPRPGDLRRLHARDLHLPGPCHGKPWDARPLARGGRGVLDRGWSEPVSQRGPGAPGRAFRGSRLRRGSG